MSKLILPPKRGLVLPRRKFLVGLGAAVCAPGIARAGFSSRQSGYSDEGFSPPTAPIVAGYQGPGDKVSGANFWIGFRAYSGAYAASLGPCVTIDNGSGGASTTVNVKADGTVSATDINNAITTAGGTGFVAKMWDQSGNGRHWTKNTAEPLVSIPASGLSPPAGAAAAGLIFLNTRGLINVGPDVGTIAQPFTVSAVSFNPNLSSLQATPFGNLDASSHQIQMNYNTAGTANELDIYAGGATAFSNTAVPDSTWGAFQLVYDNTSPDIYYNGSSTGTGTLVSGGFNSPNTTTIGSTAIPNQYYDHGILPEIGMWAFGFNLSQKSSMNSNQRAYWGF